MNTYVEVLREVPLEQLIAILSNAEVIGISY